MHKKLNWALIFATVAGLATIIRQTIEAGGGAIEVAAALLTTGAALLFGLWRDDDGDGIPNVRDVSLILGVVLLSGCGAMQTAEAEVVVDGWGLSASCKSDHVCVETPIAPLCWPIPAKLAERICHV